MNDHESNVCYYKVTSFIYNGFFFLKIGFFFGFLSPFFQSQKNLRMITKEIKCFECNRSPASNYKGNESNPFLANSLSDFSLKLLFKIKNPLCKYCLHDGNKVRKFWDLINLSNLNEYEDIDLNVGPVKKSVQDASVRVDPVDPVDPVACVQVEPVMEHKHQESDYANVRLHVPKGIQLISCSKCSSTPDQVNSGFKQVCLQCYINGLQVKLCVICQSPVRNPQAKTCVNEGCQKQAIALTKKNPNKKTRKVEQSNEVTKLKV